MVELASQRSGKRQTRQQKLDSKNALRYQEMDEDSLDPLQQIQMDQRTLEEDLSRSKERPKWFGEDVASIEGWLEGEEEEEQEQGKGDIEDRIAEIEKKVSLTVMLAD